MTACIQCWAKRRYWTFYHFPFRYISLDVMKHAISAYYTYLPTSPGCQLRLLALLLTHISLSASVGFSLSVSLAKVSCSELLTASFRQEQKNMKRELKGRQNGKNKLRGKDEFVFLRKSQRFILLSLRTILRLYPARAHNCLITKVHWNYWGLCPR